MAAQQHAGLLVPPQLSIDCSLSSRRDLKSEWRSPLTALSFWGEYGQNQRFKKVGKVTQVCQDYLGALNNFVAGAMKSLAHAATHSEMELRAQYHLTSEAFAEYRGEHESDQLPKANFCPPPPANNILERRRSRTIKSAPSLDSVRTQQSIDTIDTLPTITQSEPMF